MTVLRRAARLALAAAGGAAVYASFEPTGWWWAAILGVACYLLALIPHGGRTAAGTPGASGAAAPAAAGQGPGFAALTGFVFGLANFLCTLPWIGEFVGALPYVALAVVLAGYSAVGGVFLALALRHRWGLAAAPFIAGAVEWARSSFPFGGFAWVRLAWGQIDGPLAALARFGGPALVSLATCAAGAALAALVVRALGGSPASAVRAGNPGAGSRPGAATAGRRLHLPAALCLVVIAAAGLGAGMTVDPQATRTGQVRAAAVQGNVPRMGLDFNAQRRAVLANHVRETERLADSGAGPQIVIWPENAADVNPLVDPAARALVDETVAAVDAPVLVGTVTRDEVGMRNTMVAFDPEDGPGDHHHKKYLQPFGETMPLRDLLRHVTPLVDQAGDMKPGDGDGTVRLGGVTVGVATCYEVIVDAAYRDAVHAGAQILTTPTNNATFGFTDMTYQQLAMSRMRAIELDRAVVVAATSGVSAIVSPDGSVVESTGIFEAGHLVADLPLKAGLTPAARLGAVVQAGVVMMGLAFGLTATLTRTRSRRRRGTAK